MKKNGFTLVEILLCLAIVGLVSAMGIVAVKSNVNRAYDYYYYTGFVNLYNALMDTRLRDGQMENGYDGRCAIGHSDGDPNSLNRSITCHLNNLLGTGPIDNNVITTKNGIRYTIINDSAFYDVAQGNDLSNTPIITMTIPAPKTRGNNRGSVNVPILLVSMDPEDDDIVLGPIFQNHPYFIMPDPNAEATPFYRRDLLPTYYDDGVRGRAAGTYTNRRYYSYADALCNRTDITALINAGADRGAVGEDFSNYCSPARGVTQIGAIAGEAINGILRFADPRNTK